MPLHGAQRRPCNGEREVGPRLGSGDATVLWDLHQVARSRVRAVAVAPGAVEALREPPLSACATGRPRSSLLQRTALYARDVGATRCVALVPSCTPAPHHRTRPPVYTAPQGRPTGSPLHCLPEGFAPLRKRTETAACSQRSNKDTALPARERPARTAG